MARKLRKLLRITAAVLAITGILASTAMAAGSSPRFTDIPASSIYAESTAYLAEHGITCGVGNNQYSPERPITIREWAVFLCRAQEKPDSAVASQEDVMASCLQQCYLNGWLDVNAVTAPGSTVCRGELLLSAFHAFDIPVYDRSLYPGGARMTGWENAVRVGIELGLCPNGADACDSMTRGDAALLLFSLMSQQLEPAQPPLLEELTIQSAQDTALNDYLLEIDRIPAPILDAFDAAGWEYHIDYGYLQSYSAEHGLNCAGLTVYSEDRIYVGPASSTIHEFGHFLDWALGFPAIQDQLYEEELQGALIVLRDYAGTNSHEYFADYFAYWIRNSDQPDKMKRLQAVTPKTYAYFSNLEAQGWTA